MHDAAENQFLLSKLNQDSYSYWIGLYQNTHDSAFTWKDGTAVDFENWNDYEPNNSGGMEGCVTMDKFSSKLGTILKLWLVRRSLYP